MFVHFCFVSKHLHVLHKSQQVLGLDEAHCFPELSKKLRDREADFSDLQVTK